MGHRLSSRPCAYVLMRADATETKETESGQVKEVGRVFQYVDRNPQRQRWFERVLPNRKTRSRRVGPPQTATAALLLLLSDQRFFLARFTPAPERLVSLPGLRGGKTISWGSGRQSSSKLVGRAVAIEVSRGFFCSVSFAMSFGAGAATSMVAETLDWMVSNSANLVVFEVLRPLFTGDDTAVGVGPTTETLVKSSAGTASSSLGDSAATGS